MDSLFAVRRGHTLLWFWFSLLLAATPPVEALDNPIPDPIPSSAIRVGLETIATGLVAPNLLVDPADGTDRLLVVDQPGQIWLIKNGVLNQTPFLDVSSRLVNLNTTFDERGLFGLALHPQFATPGTDGYRRLYTYTSEPNIGTGDFFDGTINTDHQSVVAEWFVDPNNPDVVDPSTRREILRIDQPQATHNAGMLAFGPDMKLFIALGDGGNGDDQGDGHSPQGNAQDLEKVHGKILRIDPLGTNSANGEYGIPGNNPFTDNPDAVDEIFAYGFRNPFRFSFELGPDGSRTNKMIIADVGQHDIEEVSTLDVSADGGSNFGWRIKEGTFTFDEGGPGVDGDVIADSPGQPPGLVDPVVQYDHSEGRAIIGGYVYRGNEMAALKGRYVFADFEGPGTGQGRIFEADLDSPNPEIRELLLDDGPLVNGGQFDFRIKGFGQDAEGNVYVLAGEGFGLQGSTGTVLRLIPISGDMDCDGDVDFDDVDDFVLGLADPEGYEALYGVPPVAKGDMDTDGDVDFDDIPGFVAELGVTQTVPEPPTGSLVITCGLLGIGVLLAGAGMQRGGAAAGRNHAGVRAATYDGNKSAIGRPSFKTGNGRPAES